MLEVGSVQEMVADDRALLALGSLLETERDASLDVLIAQMRTFPWQRLHRLAMLVGPGSTAERYLNLILAERDAPALRLRFQEWLSSGADLEEGMLLVARAGYPTLAPRVVRERLDRLAGEIRPGTPRAGGVPALRHMGEVLARSGFKGEIAEYHDPDNSYINCVLAQRRGLPISLSVLWILLGKRLGLPISGIALPKHFIACLATPAGPVYFDPFHEGAILTLRDVRVRVMAAGRQFHPDYLRPATSLQIVQRSFANLLHAYQINEDVERVRLVRQYLSVVGTLA